MFEALTIHITGPILVFAICFIATLFGCYKLEHDYGNKYHHMKNICIAFGCALFGFVLFRFD